MENEELRGQIDEIRNEAKVHFSEIEKVKSEDEKVSISLQTLWFLYWIDKLFTKAVPTVKDLH